MIQHSECVTESHAHSPMVDIEIHAIHINHVIKTYTLDSFIIFPHIDNPESMGYT